EHTAAMGLFNGFVHLDRHAEIVGGDDELPIAHVAAFLSPEGRAAGSESSKTMRPPGRMRSRCPRHTIVRPVKAHSQTPRYTNSPNIRNQGVGAVAVGARPSRASTTPSSKVRKPAIDPNSSALAGEGCSATMIDAIGKACVTRDATNCPGRTARVVRAQRSS